jgi:hypothetical protein
MMLLDEVIAAHGGLDRWLQLQRFTIHTSVDGALFTHKGRAGALKDVVISGHTRDQHLCITGFPAANKRGVYRPDRVAIETLDGATLEVRDNPRSGFADHTDQTPWDDLHLTHFCGYAAWTGLTAPFLFVRPGFQTEELGPWQEDGETWRRLKVVFPPDIVTHSQEQIFFFDQNGLQRRMDFRATDIDGAHIAHYSWAHQAFSGIVLATLRRAVRVRDERTPISKPAYINIEIFDALFE